MGGSLSATKATTDARGSLVSGVTAARRVRAAEDAAAAAQAQAEAAVAAAEAMRSAAEARAVAQAEAAWREAARAEARAAAVALSHERTSKLRREREATETAAAAEAAEAERTRATVKEAAAATARARALAHTAAEAEAKRLRCVWKGCGLLTRAFVRCKARRLLARWPGREARAAAEAWATGRALRRAVTTWHRWSAERQRAANAMAKAERASTVLAARRRHRQSMVDASRAVAVRTAAMPRWVKPNSALAISARPFALHVPARLGQPNPDSCAAGKNLVARPNPFSKRFYDPLQNRADSPLDVLGALGAWRSFVQGRRFSHAKADRADRHWWRSLVLRCFVAWKECLERRATPLTNPRRPWEHFLAHEASAATLLNPPRRAWTTQASPQGPAQRTPRGWRTVGTTADRATSSHELPAETWSPIPVRRSPRGATPSSVRVPPRPTLVAIASAPNHQPQTPRGAMHSGPVEVYPLRDSNSAAPRTGNSSLKGRGILGRAGK